MRKFFWICFYFFSYPVGSHQEKFGSHQKKGITESVYASVSSNPDSLISGAYAPVAVFFGYNLLEEAI